MKKRSVYLLGLLLSLLLVMPQANKAQYNKDYFFYIGRRYLVEDRYRDAIETLNILLKADPSAYEGYLWRGIAKYNLGDFYGAEADFTAAIDKNPVYTMAYAYRAVSRSRLGNYDDALGDFREAIDLRPDMAGSYYSRGLTYLLNRQFEQAIADFDEFAKYEPNVPEAYIYKGTAYLYLKDTLSAMENFDRAVLTNRFSSDAYGRRGALHLMKEDFDDALADFDRAIEYDSTHIISYFNRAILFAETDRPERSIEDFSKVIEFDSTMAIAWFNRAILRSQIGDYNRALDDYGRVAELTPSNVLVYYNRAGLNLRQGNTDDAIADYGRAIELYPDFSNAYLGRSAARFRNNDMDGAESDQKTAELKIAEYRSKVADSTFSIYADTSRSFNRLMSFDPDFSRREYGGMASTGRVEIQILPLFKFSIMRTDSLPPKAMTDYVHPGMDAFIASTGIAGLALTNRDSDLPADSLVAIDRAVARLAGERPGWLASFSRGVSQYLIRQYTNSVNYYTRAVEEDPSNPFLYINRSAARSEMIDFISSIDESFHTLSFDNDPVSRLRTTVTRTYSYDEALFDLNKAAKLLPDFAYIYYNRAGLHCKSGNMPAAIEDYTRAIELYPYFAEAYYNRGLVQVYLKDTRKGFLDISKAGELGMSEAYEILRRYADMN